MSVKPPPEPSPANDAPDDGTLTYTDAQPQPGGANSATPASAVRTDLRVRTDERYELGELHGEGGLGRVLLAFDRDLQRTVALKQLRHLGGDAEARFVREARITARLEHPAIVPVHDAGQHRDGQPYYAMKLVAGQSLRDAIRAADALDQRLRLLPNVLAVAEAMAYAHSRRVVHRDLKPSNVVLGEFGETVVIDWGLAKHLDDPADEDVAPADQQVDGPELTRVGDVLGTPAYMAPEQARGEAVDARADVYALGALLYHVLTGEPAYAAASSREILDQVLAAPPPPIGERVPKLAPELVAIVDKAMARAPGDRYASAAGFRDDLRRFQAGRLVQAHRYSLRQRAARFARRHRAALTSLGLAAVAVGATYAVASGPGAVAICAFERSDLAAAWPDRRRAIEQSLGADASGAGWEIARTRIDERFEALAQARRTTCLATQRKLQSAALMDQRLACLDQREAELGALIRLSADDPVPDRLNGVVRALSSLPAVDGCLAHDFATREPLPNDPAAREAIGRVGRSLAALRARGQAGEREGLVEEAEELLAEARTLGYAPNIAAALQSRAPLFALAGRVDEARDAYRDAALAADRGGDDRARLHAESGYIILLTNLEDRVADARAALPRLEAIAARLGTLEADAEVANAQANIAYAAAEYATAATWFQRAADIYLEIEGEGGMNRLTMLRRLGQALYEQRLGEPAVAVYRTALAAARQELGEQHLEVARLIGELANALDRAGQREQVDELREQSLAMTRAIQGDRPTVAIAFSILNLGISHAKRGEHEASLARYLEGLAMVRELFGDEHTRTGDAYVNVSAALSKLGRHDEAIAEAERAVDIYVGAVGEAHARTADTRRLLAKRLAAAGRIDRAIQTYERALTWFRRADGSAVAAVPTWLDLGELLLAERRWAAADRILTEAAAAVAADPEATRPSNRAWVSFYLAQARARGGRPNAKARALGERARRIAVEADDDELLGELDTWLGDER